VSKRQATARFSLPEAVDPPVRRCFVVPVPDDPYHIAAFKGSIYKLGRAFSWQDDSAHTAIDVAAVWMAIFNDLEECSPMDTFRQPDDCTLEVSRDGGLTWSAIFNASGCVDQGILDAIDSGTVSAGGQQPAGGEGTAGQCYSYRVRLDGNGRWISPIALGVGDLITVSNVQGAWWSGELLETWACGNGYIYTLGACTGISMGTASGDPLNTLDHMRLIGNLPNESAPFFDMFNTSYTVTDADLQNLILQANDGDLSDNDGSITFEVEICKGGWAHTFDFTLASYSTIFIPHEGRAIWESGVGWKPNPAAASDDRLSLIQFNSSTFANTTFKSVHWSLGDQMLTGRALWQWAPNGSVDRTESASATDHTTLATDTMTHFFLGLDSVANPCPPLRFVTFTGTGTDPF